MKSPQPSSAIFPALGDRVKDVITGTTGIMVAYTDWLYGCRRVGILQEKPNKDGKPHEAAWFDEAQVRVIETAAIKPTPGAGRERPAPAVTAAGTTGGPPRGEERR